MTRTDLIALDLDRVEARELGEAFEAAGARVNALHMRGLDTTEADAEFERLYALLVEKGLCLEAATV